MSAIGEDILSIGSRKWESNQNSMFESAPNLGDNATFMLPNVANVRLNEHIALRHRFDKNIYNYFAKYHFYRTHLQSNMPLTISLTLHSHNSAAC